MEFKQVIGRLNELYQRSQQSALTNEEIEERDHLRRIYLDGIRKQIQATIEKVDLIGSHSAEVSHNDKCDCGACHH